MKLNRTLCILFSLLIIITGCFIGAGTHGSLKSYTFNCKKDTLQKVVMRIIGDNQNLFRDTTLDYLGSSPLLESSNCMTCSAGDNYYNDIKHYVTMKIYSGLDTNEYTFRYYGADEGWDSTLTSGIIICYAYDKNSNGGSEGNGKITDKQIEKFAMIFEKEFVDKVNVELSKRRVE